MRERALGNRRTRAAPWALRLPTTHRPTPRRRAVQARAAHQWGGAILGKLTGSAVSTVCCISMPGDTYLVTSRLFWLSTCT